VVFQKLQERSSTKKCVLSFNMEAPNPVIASWKRRDIFRYNNSFVNLSRSLR
jgi:hypothetical protein